MTRDEANALADELNRDAPDRDSFRRIVRESAGEWEVVKVHLPGDLQRSELHPTVAAEEKPPQQEDPAGMGRSEIEGGAGAGGIRAAIVDDDDRHRRHAHLPEHRGDGLGQQSRLLEGRNDDA